MISQEMLHLISVDPHTDADADDRHNAAMAKVMDYHFERYTSTLGCDEEFAYMLAMIRTHLCENMVRLGRFNQGFPIRGIDDAMVKILGITDALFEFDSDLMGHWKRFIDMLALSSNRRDTTIDICLERVDEQGKTLEMLLGVFKLLYRPRLFFISSYHSAKFAIEVMKVNPTLKAITIGCLGTVTNPLPFKSRKTATKFVNAVVKHGVLKTLSMDACELGRTKALLSVFVPTLHHVTEVSLAGNGIGSCGGAVTLIANCLALNPYVQWLCLSSNNLNDGDVSKLAASLKTNTTLRVLGLSDNDFGKAGFLSLLRAIYGDGEVDLNSVSDANHHCRIDACKELDELHLNKVGVSNNRVSKILYAALRGMDTTLGETPTNIVPNLLGLLQEGGRANSNNGKTNNSLDAVFQYVREWNGILINATFGWNELNISGSVEKVTESLGRVNMMSA